jgi:hypothetical protein
VSFTTPYTQSSDYMTLMALEYPEQKERKTRIGVILIGFTIAAVATAIGFAMALTPSHLGTPAKKCGQVAVKMFDDSNVPKYFVGPGYKITPMAPGVTDVMINICR